MMEKINLETSTGRKFSIVENGDGTKHLSTKVSKDASTDEIVKAITDMMFGSPFKNSD